MQTNIQASIGNCSGDSPWKPATTNRILMAVSTKVANHAQATNCRVVIWLDKDQVLPVKTPFWSVKKKEEKEQKSNKKEESVHRIWIHVHLHVLKRP